MNLDYGFAAGCAAVALPRRIAERLTWGYAPKSELPIETFRPKAKPRA